MAKAKRKGRGRQTLVKTTVLATESLIERDTTMFKDWVNGMTQKAIAEKYDLSEDGVALVSKKYDWRSLKKDLAARAFSKAIDSIKDLTVTMTGLLHGDMLAIAKEVETEKRKLTSEERGHIRALMDRFLKESRLEDGKPTEVTSGTVRTELVLPPGVSGFGIIPPDPRVTMTEATTESAKEVIDLDKIDED